jgi:hypothetical protein
MPLPEQEESGVATPASPKMDFGNILLHIGNIMSATSAGMQGRPYNPQAILENKLREQLAQRESKRQDEELGLRRQQINQQGEQQRTQEFQAFTSFLKEFDIEDPDGKISTGALKAFVKSRPNLSKELGDVIDNITITRKAGRKEEDPVLKYAGKPLDPATIQQYLKTGDASVLKPMAEARPIQPTDAIKYTPESIKAYQTSNDPSVLAPREQPNKTKDFGNDREALAAERGFLSFGDAPQNIKSEINKEVKRREDERLQNQRTIVNNTTGNTRIDNESNMRKEFEAQSKSFIEVRDSYKKIAVSAKDPSPAGDLSLIFAYMKLLDPISVVREGEQATAQNARSVPESVRGLYNKVVLGQKLTDSQRADFVNRADGLYKGYEETHKKRTDEFRRVAASAGLRPDQVVIDLSGGAPAQQPAATAQSRPRATNPKTGEVMEYDGTKWVPAKK